MFYWLVDVLPGLAVDLLPLVVLLAGYLRWRHVDAAARRAMAWMTLLAAVFGALDFALLTALPSLGLSFGPAGVALAVLWVLRFGSLLAWMYLSLSSRAGKIALLAAQVLLTAALVYSFYIEPFNVHVTRLEQATPLLSTGRRLRIVQLSDIHVERTTRRERRVVEDVQALRPDIIVLTGDYLNNSYAADPLSAQDLRWLVGELRAPCGIYAVSGSTEKPTRVMELFRGLDVQVLNNAFRRVSTPAGEIAIVGISDTHHNDDIHALTRVAGSIPAGVYSLLIYHNPDLIETAAGAGIDFYLAGHTHGGQIRVPFYGAVITFSIYGKQFEQGLFEHGGTRMYVSRGLGMEGKKAPRARFLAPPEIVVLDLAGQ